MNKHIRVIPALALGMAVLSIPTLATAATTINVVDPAQLLAKGAGPSCQSRSLATPLLVRAATCSQTCRSSNAPGTVLTRDLVILTTQ